MGGLRAEVRKLAGAVLAKMWVLRGSGLDWARHCFDPRPKWKGSVWWHRYVLLLHTDTSSRVGLHWGATMMGNPFKKW